jgi:hypothetical protein
VGTVVGAVDGQALADAISTAAASLYKAVIATLASYQGLKMSVKRANTKFATILSTAAAGPGIPGNDPQPKQTAGLTSKITDFAGRAYQGRVYWPFPPKEVADTVGHPSFALVTAYNDLAAQLLTVQVYTMGATTCSLTPVIFHKQAGVNPTPVIGYKTAQKWATQRKRGDYGRPNAQLS